MICFWCGKEKENTEGTEKKWIPGDYEPCDECKKHREQGIDFIEVSEKPTLYDTQPDLCGYYPTSRHMILKEEVVKRIFSRDVLDEILEKRIGFIDKDMFDQLYAMIGE